MVGLGELNLHDSDKINADIRKITEIEWRKAHLAREAELLGRQLAETWHNAAAGGDRDQLQNDHKFKN